MKLLLIEDHVESAELLVRLLQGIGHEVVHKTQGLHGLKAAREEQFDAILLDFNLPDIDGSQIGLLLRPVMRNRHVPLIALTAQGDRATRNKAKAFGFSGFIAKPWNISELITTLRELTGQQVSQA